MIVSRAFFVRRTLAIAALVALSSSVSAGADEPGGSRVRGLSIPGAFYEPARTLAARPARLSDLAFAAERLTASERHELAPLTNDERRDLARSEKGLRKVGLVRRLESAVRLAGTLPSFSRGSRGSWSGGLLEQDEEGSMTWTTAIVSPGATGIRLLIGEASAPGGRIYVYSKSGEVHGPYTFDCAIAAEGFWTNTVFADEVFVEAQFPASSAPRLTIAAIGHLEGGTLAGAGLSPQSADSPMSTEASTSTTCFVDASCVATREFGSLESASHAVATLLFHEGSSFYACSGGLVGTTDHSFEPYLLTANHCFGSQSSASSLEAVFNYRNPTCNGPYPSMSSFPRTLGSTLLATSTTSDFTLVRLGQAPPAGSYFLGWSTDDYAHSGGTSIYRLSYPAPDVGIWPQYYSRHAISSIPSPGTCRGYAQGDFIYSKDTLGGVGEGSSGAPVLLGDGRIVGQLLGACGSNVDDDCDSMSNSTVDGSFAVSYPQIAQWLNPSGVGGPVGPSSCTPNATTLCLNGNRFKVEVSWRVASQGTGGSGTAVPLSGDTGYFWFFSSGNVELVVKALDGRAVNGYYWIFYGALSDVEYTITVTDTSNGTVKTYSNPQGQMASRADTAAFR
ncbi:MAG TPA: trypsin-like peptidase domain-containing protein [Thermoanaerobaculia bacterium]|nr:trypsin-like peptidase domain-containing protein [Thermoanaerobaculia bacterium]